MNNPFYVTTPIYYVNDEPHLGHAYTTILADVLARYARLAGRPTFFLTGTDEHGQKVQNAARHHAIPPLDYANQMVGRFQQAWLNLDIAYYDFIRTTEPRHVRVVQTVLQDLWNKGEIYRGDYEGWYCVPDERFWTEKEIIDGRCPDCSRPVERIVETNYFFRMSAYQSWLIEHIHSHPNFIRPEHRRNEVLGFLRQPLGDLCISRPVSRLNWGIPLPFDPAYVTYVWFDALLNYVTAAGYLSDDGRFARFWPHTLHLIGKDILTTHAVYWPIMLQAAGLPQPQTIFAHGWWVIEGTKMGKSLGNAIKPLDLTQLYGVDPFRYFLLREMAPGRDAEFNPASLAARYQAELANDLGNLLHRLVNMIGRYHDGLIPQPGPFTAEETHLQAICHALTSQTFTCVDDLALHEALAGIMNVIREINGYLERTSPWKQAKQGNHQQIATSLYVAAEALRLASVLLHPVMPQRTSELWHRLGWQPPADLTNTLTWGQLRPGSPITAGPPLFPRLTD